MIRKEGKAKWTYTCEPCDERVECVDQFRAIEFGQWHERTYSHAGIALGHVWSQAMAQLAEAIKPALDAANSLMEYTAPTYPTNRPHDPSLLRDRRKWGGK